MNTRQMMKDDTYINQHYNFSDFSYRTKLRRLAFLANTLGTLSGVGQCRVGIVAREAHLVDLPSW